MYDVAMALAGKVQCRNPKCRKPTLPRRRWLCKRCYRLYRELYEPLKRGCKNGTSKGFGDFNGGYPLADEPTTALPRTSEKMDVFRERAELHRALFHPGDARAE